MEAFDENRYIYRIRFMDSAGREVYVYNPINVSVTTTSYQLGVNEELIGVYGVKNRNSWFTSFGFIVKVKANN